ncbi:transmembrane 6 superfamily member 2b [Lepisosteus oculatus]|uniref:Transmembrane 6 superfamily member 2b n=1 Tax=Lepisosteus oculatus TaxID=7918 RepID=W5MB45_LEPOC|nr:PREDICTED: transmembrane 6 superfamily member 2 [Lepisosteus oculatus]
MNLPTEIGVFLLSLSSLGVIYAMNNMPSLQDPVSILGIGAAVLVMLYVLVYYSVRNNSPKDPLFYVFAVFSFTCVIDLIIAAEEDGYVSGFMEFYMKEGEPYLRTAFGIMMCYWDGTVHYFLYLVMVRRVANKQPYRGVGLFWIGSLLVNMIVFVPGIVLGKYGSEIRPAFLLNVPYVLVPMWAAITLFHRPRELPIIPADTIAAEQRKGLLHRPLDMILLLFLLWAMVIAIFRGFVVLECPLDFCFTYIYQYEPYLKDPVVFPKVLMLLYLFYGLPMLAVFTYGLVKPGCTWMLDWTLFFAGGVAQAQWSHIGASLHPRTPFTYRVPEDTWWPVLLLNLLFALGPQLLAWRCHRHPEFFMKNVPQGQTNQEKKQN